MISQSPVAYAWVTTWVVILHSIGPLSVVCFVALWVLPHDLPIPKVIEYWIIAETIFYLFTLLYLRYYLQRPALHPLPISKEKRDKLFELCLESTEDPEQYISKWFFDEPLSAIKRDNIKEFFLWGFFNADTVNSSHDDEIEEYVRKLEARLGTVFEPGRSDVKCLRLTLDKVGALHRSLTWYMCILVVDILTYIYLRWSGFFFYRGSLSHTLTIVPPRPQALAASHRSPTPDITYWHQPHTSGTELPILFLHGIGVGLYPYMEFLRELNQGRRSQDGRVGILAIEILSVSSRLTVAMPPKEELCKQIRAILNHHGFERFVLVSHSYGSVITTHLLKTADLSQRITSVILVDPISILLNQPDVAYNFTVRRPRFANEWLLWYFGSKDIGVAHTLSRTFFWSENILWKEDLLEHNTIVFLGGKDAIINSPKVLQYLQGLKEVGQTTQRTNKKGQQSKLRVVWSPGLDHGQGFDLRDWRRRLKNEVVEEAARLSES